MKTYQIFTESSSDISREKLAEWDVVCNDLTYTCGEDGKMPLPATLDEFYKKMREGMIVKTAAINSEVYVGSFEKTLQAGLDILSISFSSGLSSSVSAAMTAANELRLKYPDRKIIVIDTKCASAGQGLAVYLVVKKQQEGATIEEAAAYAEEISPKISHWFTVDDLVYLKRGGRISPAVAFVGSVLGIKPILHVDDEGHLINVSKARGRAASIKAIADMYSKSAVDPKSGTVFISHADCRKDAEQLAAILKKEHGIDVALICDISSVIGGHSGPGTLALFFVAQYR